MENTVNKVANLIEEVLELSQEVGLDRALEVMESHLEEQGMDRAGVYALMLGLIQNAN